MVKMILAQEKHGMDVKRVILWGVNRRWGGMLL